MRSNSSANLSNVPSVEPSSMTITSKCGYRSASMPSTEATIPASSLCAGTSTDTPGVSGLRYISSSPANGWCRRWRTNSAAASRMRIR
jgi:hypothetical protein